MIDRRPDEIRRARELLLSRGVREVALPADLVPGEIERSWRRSASLRVDPQREPQLLGEVDPETRLLRAAGRVMDQWVDSLSGSRLTIVLGDQDGRIVARRSAAREDSRLLDRVHAAEGFDFSEESIGTNGLGTPIESRDIVFVRGSAHFNDGLADVACSGAPVCHPITGRVIGSISLAAGVRHAHELMVSMVRQMAQQISQELVRAADARAIDLARVYRRAQVPGRSTLVMNAETIMGDHDTFSRLGVETHALLLDALRRKNWTEDARRLDLPIVGEVTVSRQGTDPQDPVFVISRSVRGGEPDPVARTAALPAPASPYAQLRRDLDETARVTGLLRVAGAAGSGRCYQAGQWLQERTGLPPFVVSGTDVGDSRTLDAIEQALAGGQGVLVRDEESAVPLGRLRRMAERLSLDATPRIVVADHCDDAVLVHDVTVPAVRVPALADDPGRIPAVARQVLHELSDGTAVPELSSAALQAILAWSWPGNVEELRAVLRPLLHLPVIEIVDLPPHIQRAGRSTRGRIAQSEYAAIVSALREAQGNKKRAAELLGIGRTTLYRKIRTLRIEPHEVA